MGGRTTDEQAGRSSGVVQLQHAGSQEDDEQHQQDEDEDSLGGHGYS